MNDFFSEILSSALSNIYTGSYTKVSLVERIKNEKGSDIEEYDIFPIIEKCIEKNVIDLMPNSTYVLTDIGLNLIKNPETAYIDLWNISVGEIGINHINAQEKPFEKQHLKTLIKLHDVYIEYLVDLKKYIKYLLLNMDEYKFEEYVIKILIGAGEAAFGEATKKTGDGGVDGYLYLTKIGQGAMPVQVKRYAENNLVSVSDIRDFLGALHRAQLYSCYFVTTSTFTKKAIDLAKENKIILINGDKLVELIIENNIDLENKYNLELLKTPNLNAYT